MGKSLSREVYVINDSWESHPPFNFFFFFFFTVSFVLCSWHFPRSSERLVVESFGKQNL